MGGCVSLYHVCFPKTGKHIPVWSDSDALNRITTAAEHKGHHCLVYHRLSSSWKDVQLAWECKNRKTRTFKFNNGLASWEGDAELVASSLPEFNPFR